jgi:hypothetical protein
MRISEQEIAAFPSTVERDLADHDRLLTATRAVVAELPDLEQPMTYEELVDLVVARIAAKLADEWNDDLHAGR